MKDLCIGPDLVGDVLDQFEFLLNILFGDLKHVSGE